MVRTRQRDTKFYFGKSNENSMAIFNSKITTSLEISDGYIKLIQISTQGKGAKVVACAFKEFSTSEPEAGTATLQGMLKEYNIKPKDLILTIPRQSVTIKNLKFPSQNPQEIDEMAGFQALKQIPYAKEEIAYGFNIIGVDAEGYSKVMLVICHRDIIERPVRILAGCGLRPAKITLSSFGLLNWFILNDDLSKRSYASPIILLDCDINNSELAIVYRGKLIYTRGLTFGSAEGTRYCEKLVDEIDKTLPIYAKESEAPMPTESVLTGIISALIPSKDELERSLNMKVEFIESFKYIPLNVPALFQPNVEKASYSSLIGAAFGPEEVDLLPKALKVSKAVKTRKRELAVAIILLCAIIVSSSSTIWNKVRQRELALKTLESKLNETSPLAAEIEKMRLATDIIKSRLAKKTEALDVLNELHKIVPPQIYLAAYTYDEEKVELKGTASVLSDVFKLVTILENSPYFKNIEVRYATKRKVGNQELIDFDIVCPLSTGEKTKR